MLSRTCRERSETCSVLFFFLTELLFYFISQSGREPYPSENDWQRFPETFQVPSDPLESGKLQKNRDSELEHGKSPSRDGYGNMKAYLQDVHQ